MKKDFFVFCRWEKRKWFPAQRRFSLLKSFLFSCGFSFSAGSLFSEHSSLEWIEREMNFFEGNGRRWYEWKIDVKAFDDFFLCREAICGTEKRLCLMKISSPWRELILFIIVRLITMKLDSNNFCGLKKLVCSLWNGKYIKILEASL